MKVIKRLSINWQPFFCFLIIRCFIFLELFRWVKKMKHWRQAPMFHFWIIPWVKKMKHWCLAPVFHFYRLSWFSVLLDTDSFLYSLGEQSVYFLNARQKDGNVLNPVWNAMSVIGISVVRRVCAICILFSVR